MPSSAAKETPALEDRAAPATPTKKKVAKKRAVEQEQEDVGQNVPALALKARDNETPAEIAALLPGVSVERLVEANRLLGSFNGHAGLEWRSPLEAGTALILPRRKDRYSYE